MPVTSLRENIVLVDRGTSKMEVFCAGPDNEDLLPSIILVHEIFGVNDHIKDLARRLAQQKLRVFAPDLFSSSSLWPMNIEQRDNLEIMRKVWASIPDSQLMADLDLVYGKIRTLTNTTSNVGIIGFCMGGAIALMYACHEPQVSYVIDFYGRIRYGITIDTKPKDPIDYIVPLKAPFLGLFAGKDELITADHIDYMTGRMEDLKKTFQIKVYQNASHAFFNDRRPNYNEEASLDAWQRVLAFINVHTKLSQEEGIRNSET